MIGRATRSWVQVVQVVTSQQVQCSDQLERLIGGGSRLWWDAVRNRWRPRWGRSHRRSATAADARRCREGPSIESPRRRRSPAARCLLSKPSAAALTTAAATMDGRVRWCHRSAGDATAGIAVKRVLIVGDCCFVYQQTAHCEIVRRRLRHLVGIVILPGALWKKKIWGCPKILPLSYTEVTHISLLRFNFNAF